MAKNDQVIFFNEPVEREMGFAAAVQVGNILTLSGLVSIDQELKVVAPGDMAGQINQIYDVMEMILQNNRATLANVVNENIYVTDIQALGQAAATRNRRYADYAPPAATAVQVSALFFPECMIEIQATAVLDD